MSRNSSTPSRGRRLTRGTQMTHDTLQLKRWWFQIGIFSFVVVTSFTYGVVRGLKTPPANAFASFSPDTTGAVVALPTRLRVLPGTKAIPIGEDTAINGQAAENIFFVSARDVRSLIRDQVMIWKRDGMESVGQATDRRGVALAINKATGERFVATAWVVPPASRHLMSNGYPVQGIIAVSDSAGGEALRPEEESGQVPGVPIMSGGKGGAVISSKAPGGRSTNSIYTNPGSVEANADYYFTHLTGNGWKLTEGDTTADAQQRVGFATYRKAREEIVLLLSEKPDSEDGLQTVVSVIRRPVVEPL